VKRYGNRSGDSGISAYEILDDAILIRFRDGGLYRYDALNPGPWALSEMKRLAQTGRGLTTFINRHVREDYAEKLN